MLLTMLFGSDTLIVPWELGWIPNITIEAMPKIMLLPTIVQEIFLWDFDVERRTNINPTTSRLKNLIAM